MKRNFRASSNFAVFGLLLLLGFSFATGALAQERAIASRTRTWMACACNI